MASVSGARRLTIESRQVDNSILLSFADNGPGIPNANINRLFDPFFSTKQVGEGTGLGLSICFGIISEHKGRIWAEHSPKGGAIFYIELPLLLQKEATLIAPAPSQSTLTSPVDHNPLSILVVDDEPSLLTLLRRVLEKLGHSVATAQNGEVALQRLDAHAFDLVICDILMPDILGPELYYQTIERHPYMVDHFIFITGNVVDIDTRTFLEKSGLPWLPKPFLPADIENAVKETSVKAVKSY
jgi:two-component system NtrC family sensor kinase